MRKFSEATKKKMSMSKIGHEVSKETRDKIRFAHLGKNLTEEHKNKIRNKIIELGVKPQIHFGEESSNWKGGFYKSSINGKRNLARKKIILKNNCEICGSTYNLQRHHWNYNKPLLVNTLCRQCHNIQHIKNK